MVEDFVLPRTAQHRDRLAPAEITMFQISEVQELPAFNGRRSFLTLRGILYLSRQFGWPVSFNTQAGEKPIGQIRFRFLGGPAPKQFGGDPGALSRANTRPDSPPIFAENFCSNFQNRVVKISDLYM